jgi:hypothetical protein
MTPRYDVFLSHSSADKPAVEKLALKLRDAWIEPFLDKWHLIPGRLWQSELEIGLRNSNACIIFVGSQPSPRNSALTSAYGKLIRMAFSG